jgi:hypothetical protein
MNAAGMKRSAVSLNLFLLIVDAGVCVCLTLQWLVSPSATHLRLISSSFDTFSGLDQAICCFDHAADLYSLSPILATTLSITFHSSMSRGPAITAE